MKKKRIALIAGGIAGLVIAALIVKLVLHRPYTSSIPVLANEQTLPVQVRDQVAEALKKARLNPNAENLGRLGMIYHSSANYDQAEQCYRLSAERDKESWIWNYYLGYLGLETGHSDAVTEQFNIVLDKNPGLLLARYYCGEEYRKQGNYELSEKHLFELIRRINEIDETGTPGRRDHYSLSTRAGFQLAMVYFDSGKYEQARQHLIQIIDSDPAFGPAYRLLGNIYSLEGNMDLSSRNVDRANDLSIYTPPVDTLMDRVVLMSRSELYLLKKIDEAVISIQPEWAMQLITHAMQYLPDNKFLISKAIKTYLWLGLNDQAATFTDQHLEMFSDDYDEILSMGQSFLNKQLYPHAIQYLTNALVHKPGDVEIRKQLATCYWNLGVKKQSNALLNEIINEHPDDLDMLAGIAEFMMFELEEKQKVLEFLVILEHFKAEDPRVQKMLAHMSEKSGSFQEAIAAYESSMEKNPFDRTTLKNLGDLYVRMKMWGKAIGHFKEALTMHPNEPYFLERAGTLLVTCPEQRLRNMEEGKEYSERAFFHIRRLPGVTVSAGRSLALAQNAMGNNDAARQVIQSTLEIARQEGTAPEKMALLEELANEIGKEN